MKRVQKLLGSLAAVVAMAVPAAMAEPVKVEIRGEPGSYQLYRGGEPYFIRGAGLDVGDIDSLARYGGNSVRTWHVGDGEILDRAHELGLTVTLCLNVMRERHGFDYDDEEAVAQQLAEMREKVMRFRDHPALLTWMIGNELNFDYQNPRVYDAVGDIAKMIKELDPNHPVTTATAGIGADVLKDIRERAPQVDFISVQVYGMLFDLPEVIDELDIRMPIMVTEWGTIGHWEVDKTSWGAPLEMSSMEKAATYKKGWNDILSQLEGKVIGSYVFLWGQKQERTPTWYGVFAPNGGPTETVDVMQRVWTGDWPANRAPQLKSLELDGKQGQDGVQLVSGQRYDARTRVRDPDDDDLTYRWVLLAESEATQVGGDKEEVPEDLSRYLASNNEPAIELTAPGTEGAYRLFIYASDALGATAHANIPFYVTSDVQ